MSAVEEASDGARSHFGVVGRESGPAGRVARLAVGLTLLIAVGSALAQDGWRLAGQVALATVATFLVYMVLMVVLHRRVLARMNPWVGTFIMLAPLTLWILPAWLSPWSIPPWLGLALTAYIGLGLTTNAVVGYGGCEVIILPSLLLGKRYPVYCPLNAVDVVERPLGYGQRRALHIFAAVVAAAVGAYLYVMPLLGFFGVARPVAPSSVAPLLLIPAVVLFYLAWRSFHEGQSLGSERVWPNVLGGLVCVLVVLIQGDSGIGNVVFWSLMPIALATIGIRALYQRVRGGPREGAPQEA